MRSRFVISDFSHGAINLPRRSREIAPASERECHYVPSAATPLRGWKRRHCVTTSYAETSASRRRDAPTARETSFACHFADSRESFTFRYGTDAREERASHETSTIPPEHETARNMSTPANRPRRPSPSETSPPTVRAAKRHSRAATTATMTRSSPRSTRTRETRAA